jgi:dTDP-4-amino-4,6-dideoxygalactose transaminase
MSGLAIDGGTPVRSGPIPPWPCFGKDEVDAAAEVLRSGRVNQWTGPYVGDFEQALCECFDAPHAVAVANGTVALELALMALGIGPGDEVVVTPRSFVASASCVLMAGAIPVFADIDPVSQNITADTIRAVLTPHTRAIIPVHLAGHPCDMPAIMQLAATHDLLVIEDCAQAHGAMIEDRPVGSFGHASAWSFCQDKILSTGGEGGAVLFKDEDAWQRAWSFKDHGKDFFLAHIKNPPPGFRWLHAGIGTNWRLTSMQAAIGLRQLSKLGTWTAARSANAKRLAAVLEAYPSITCHSPANRYRHAYYRFTALIDAAGLRSGWNRDRILSALNAEGLPAFAGACPAIFREKVFEGRLTHTPECPAAEAVGAASLNLLVHPTLDNHFLDEAAACLRKVFDAATA